MLGLKSGASWGILGASVKLEPGLFPVAVRNEANHAGQAARVESSPPCVFPDRPKLQTGKVGDILEGVVKFPGAFSFCPPVPVVHILILTFA